MLLVVLAILAVATVPLAGGRLGRLADVQLCAVWALAAALVAQVLIISVVPGGDASLHRVLHLATYVAVLAWVAINRDLHWRWTLLAGGALNFIVIVANNGVMPASRAALETAGLGAGHGFENSAPVAHATFAFLGDVFAIPASFPLANVFSIGDGLIVVGIFLMLHRQCESFLAYLLARAGSLAGWRETGSHTRSRRSTQQTPTIPVAS